MVELNGFGVAVKKKLIDLNQSQAWLVEEVRKKTNQYFDNAFLQKLMTGKVTSEPKVQAIKEILNIK